MQVASVIGREFAFRILQSISDMREDLKSQLLNLQGLELIYEKSLFPELEYIFKHALTQEVAYNSLLSNRRKEIHKRIGSAIEELYAGKLEEFYEVLAYHYSRGEEFEKACLYLKLSGKRAVRSHALWEAYGFYKEAVELLNRFPATEENKKELLDVIQLMRTPIALLGFPEGCLRFLQQGERLARELGGTGHLAALYSAIGAYYSHAGEHSTSFRYTEEGFEEARKAQDIQWMAPLGFWLSASYNASGQYGKILDKVPEVIDLIEKKGRESDFFGMAVNPYSFICAQCSNALCHLGRFEEGKAFLEKAYRNAIGVGEPATLAHTELVYGLSFYLKGDFKPAKEHLEKCIGYSEEAKWHLGAAIGLCILGNAHSFLGDPETGSRHAEKGLRIYRESRIEFLLSVGNWLSGCVHLNSGDLENAGASMEEALRLSRKNGERSFEGLALLGLGMVLGKREPRQVDQAEECFSKGLAILQDQKMRPWYSQGRMFLGEFYLDSGEKERAAENLKEAEAMFQEMGMDYWLHRTRTLLQRACG
jgi:tetratricopeptide (TPR) repeat protein